MRRVNLVTYCPGLSDARHVDSLLVALSRETPPRRVVLLASDLRMQIWKLGSGLWQSPDSHEDMPPLARIISCMLLHFHPGSARSTPIVGTYSRYMYLG